MRADARCPGWGIHLGCETRDTRVENNLVYGTLESVHVWYNDRNIVMENNIFVGSRNCQINYQNPEELKHENVKFLRNIVYCTADRRTPVHCFGRTVAARRIRLQCHVLDDRVCLNDPIIEGLPECSHSPDWRSTRLGQELNHRRSVIRGSGQQRLFAQTRESSIQSRLQADRSFSGWAARQKEVAPGESESCSAGSAIIHTRLNVGSHVWIIRPRPLTTSMQVTPRSCVSPAESRPPDRTPARNPPGTCRGVRRF